MTSRDPREDHLLSAVIGHVSNRAAAQEAARDGVLASDADRDAATRILADAFAAGRTRPRPSSSNGQPQRWRRARTASSTTCWPAWAATGLPARKHPLRKAVFGVVAFASSPFVLIASLLTFFGTDTDDHVGGLVLLVALLPGLFALWRWAWPRS